ncbi:MAG: NAD(P)H-dependent oxidoreductase [Bacteroidota bacterium]
MITIVVGTNRKNSLSKTIAHYYQDILIRHHVESKILDLNGLPSDFTATALYENFGKNEIFNQFRHQMELAEKFVFIVPEYNGSFPGVLKAFLDGMKYPDGLSGKKAALVGLSAGVQGGALALSHLNDIFSYLGVNVLAMRVKLAQIKSYMKDSKIDNLLYNELLDIQARQLIEF